MKRSLAPLPTYKPLDISSPQIVRVLDDIRFGPLDHQDEYAEFCWFIREYARIFRHHVEHAECRLGEIHEAYRGHYAHAEKELASRDDHDDMISFSTQSKAEIPNSTYKIYWDFECFLQATSVALDTAARIVGTAYRSHTPPNFNKFRKTAPDGELKRIFVRSQTRWVRKMKAYRDCFLHYTPVDTHLGIHAIQYAQTWEIRGKLPINPEAREILRFRFSRRRELLRYAVSTWKNLIAFDRAIASEIDRLYRTGEYPKKHINLFHLGRGRSGGEGE